MLSSGTEKNLKGGVSVKSGDIRNEGVTKEHLTPSGKKQLNSELKASDHKSVASDSGLHADTTTAGENTIAHDGVRKSDPWAGSAKKSIKDVNVKTNKEFNS